MILARDGTRANPLHVNMQARGTIGLMSLCRIRSARVPLRARGHEQSGPLPLDIGFDMG
jgi:hypothetical protein